MDVEQADTGYEPMDDATIKATLSQVRALILQNWCQIKKTATDTESGKVSVGITLALAFGNKVSTKANIRWSVRHSDETEAEYVEDPSQQDGNLDEQEVA